MPIYEFECKKCGIEFDAETKIDADPPACIKCHSETKRLISIPRVVRVAPIRGPIWSEKQIHDTHGKNWRETKPAGRKLYFDA